MCPFTISCLVYMYYMLLLGLHVVLIYSPLLQLYIIRSIIHIKHRQVRFYTLRRIALAFALSKHMLKLENKSKDACDFGRELWIASRAATCAKKLRSLFTPSPIGINC